MLQNVLFVLCYFENGVSYLWLLQEWMGELRVAHASFYERVSQFENVDSVSGWGVATKMLKCTIRSSLEIYILK